LQFTKENLFNHRGYITFSADGLQGSRDAKFVARFKYGAKSSAGPFMTFLRKNFTVEEYFARLDAGESPLPIAKSKGFMLSHIKKYLREGGYPVTPAGFDQYIADGISAYKAAKAAS
jgi:hypothetical protein